MELRRRSSPPAALIGFDKAPEIDDAVRDRDIYFVLMGPGLPPQLLYQPLTDRRVGEACFELQPGACDGLNDVLRG